MFQFVGEESYPESWRISISTMNCDELNLKWQWKWKPLRRNFWKRVFLLIPKPTFSDAEFPRGENLYSTFVLKRFKISEIVI